MTSLVAWFKSRLIGLAHAVAAPATESHGDEA
jgi:hypothetical protein